MANASRNKRIIRAAFREVNENPPSTLDPSKTGAERRAQMTAIALSKAREEGATIRRRPQGSKTFTVAEMMRGYRKL